MPDKNKKFVVIAPGGDNMPSLYVGVREFPTERVIIVTPEKYLDECETAKAELDKFKIPVKIVKIEGDPWEEIFRVIRELKEIETGSELLINVATGDTVTRCAATSAAFVNGIKAFASNEEEVMMLPILKFSYYNVLTERKKEILKVIHQQDCCSTLEELSKRTKMSLPLISYHINGNLKSEGLKDLGLVETTESGGKVAVQLTTMGRLLIKGYVS